MNYSEKSMGQFLPNKRINLYELLDRSAYSHLMFEHTIFHDLQDRHFDNKIN